LRPTLQAYAKAWDDHNNYARMLISTKVFNKYLMQLINIAMDVMMWDKLIIVHKQKTIENLQFL
jgi:hypothetical protein